VREVILTGVHIYDYQDGESRLEDLVEAILLRTKMPRLRLSSLEPGELTERLLDLYADDRLCPHFHMSIQSANSKVLYEMKRQYTADAVGSALQSIARRVSGAFVGMDVIAGFPGESDEEFLDGFRRLEDLPWTRMHVFPYSSRPGTFAARRKDVLQNSTVHLRASMLRRLSDERFMAQTKLQLGTVKKGLILKSKVGEAVALTRDYWRIHIADRSASIDEVSIQIDAWESGRLGDLRGRVVL
jgi:threonylcarbamoyladenosine tRNA methylthiotransferase MtaB